jgi:8-oxo-dGTP pyrophosphatase MutT (NUDIX family)
VSDRVHELLNVYDPSGVVVGTMARGDAKARGLAAGAVQMLVVHDDGRVLLQRRREDKENGGLWDKSVGGHVLAGETFDQALVREANEELFGRADADRVVLVDAFRASPSPSHPVRARRVRIELGLRDIRYAATPGRRIINVTYHAAMYLGRTSLDLGDFAHQEEELSGLAFLEPSEVDRLLVTGGLAPNMAFLWFAIGGAATGRGASPTA